MSLELLRMRYRLGGRGDDGTIDCLGVTMRKAAEVGRVIPDVWGEVKRQWKQGRLDLATGFAPGWQRLVDEEFSTARARPQQGDVWIIGRRNGGVGIIVEGKLWTALPETGPVQIDPARVTPAEVWRS